MPAAHPVLSAVRDALSPEERVVLAVSGGRDSMVLMHAAARTVPRHISAVVTIDHGTGPAAARASALVETTAMRFGFDVVYRTVEPDAPTEAAWRAERWRALREEAFARGARIATAHTRDDQAETVLMRVMRDAGARGLAALAAPGPVLRPLLGVDRQAVGAYAEAEGIEFIDDPTNRDMRYLRNRVRRDLLPALERAQPGFRRELLEIGRGAAEWRGAFESAVEGAVPYRLGGGGLAVERSVLADYGPDILRQLWPVLAARTGVVLDRRGTERLTSFTIQSRRGTRMQLSGGVEVVHHRDALILRRADASMRESTRPLRESTRLGAWRFVRAAGEEVSTAGWTAALPTDLPLRVRTWQAGDRMVPDGEPAGAARRIKRLLRESGIEPGIRRGWPVVLSGDEIVWVPGVRRGRAATVRSGRPVAVYRCERIDR